MSTDDFINWILNEETTRDKKINIKIWENMISLVKFFVGEYDYKLNKYVKKSETLDLIVKQYQNYKEMEIKNMKHDIIRLLLKETKLYTIYTYSILDNYEHPDINKTEVTLVVEKIDEITYKIIDYIYVDKTNYYLQKIYKLEELEIYSNNFISFFGMGCNALDIIIDKYYKLFDEKEENIMKFLEAKQDK